MGWKTLEVQEKSTKREGGKERGGGIVNRAPKSVFFEVITIIWWLMWDPAMIWMLPIINIFYLKGFYCGNSKTL